MSVYSGPEIVNNGLVLHLDAANPRSYPGTGTVWSDISGSGNNGTLVSGVGYSTDNKGNMTFNGTNNYIKNDTPTLPTGNVTATICAWVNLLSVSGTWQGIAGWGELLQGQSALLDLNGGKLAFSTWGTTGGNDIISTYNVPLNTWKYVVGSINDKNIKLYTNGIIVLDSLITSTPNVTSTKLRLATTDYPGRLLNCRIAHTSIYNRALTTLEIQQNFEALRGRFSI